LGIVDLFRVVRLVAFLAVRFLAVRFFVRFFVALRRRGFTTVTRYFLRFAI